MVTMKEESYDESSMPLKLNLDDATKQLTELESKYNEIKLQLCVSNFNSQLTDMLREEASRLLAKNEELELELKSTKSEKEDYKDLAHRLRSDNEIIQLSHIKLEVKINELAEDNHHNKQYIVDLERKLTELEARNKEIEKEKEDYKDLVHRLRSQQTEQTSAGVESIERSEQDERKVETIEPLGIEDQQNEELSEQKKEIEENKIRPRRSCRENQPDCIYLFQLGMTDQLVSRSNKESVKVENDEVEPNENVLNIAMSVDDGSKEKKASQITNSVLEQKKTKSKKQAYSGPSLNTVQVALDTVRMLEKLKINRGFFANKRLYVTVAYFERMIKNQSPQWEQLSVADKELFARMHRWTQASDEELRELRRAATRSKKAKSRQH